MLVMAFLRERIVTRHSGPVRIFLQVCRVVVLQDGAIVACGPWEEVRQQVAADVLVRAANSAPHGSSDSDDRVELGDEEGDLTQGAEREGGLSPEACVRLMRATLQMAEGRRVDAKLIDQTCRALLYGGSETETKREGIISAVDFAVYLRHFGSRLAFGLLLLVTIAGAVLSVADTVWLAHWTGGTNSSAANDGKADLGPNVSAVLSSAASKGSLSQTDSLLVYVAVGSSSSFLSAIQTIALTICALRASRLLHSQARGTFLANDTHLACPPHNRVDTSSHCLTTLVFFEFNHPFSC